MKYILKIIILVVTCILSMFSISIFYCFNIEENNLLIDICWLLCIVLIHFFAMKVIIKQDFLECYKKNIFNIFSLVLFIIFLITGTLTLISKHSTYTMSRLIFIVLIGVCGEEIIFRGIIWDALNDLIKIKNNLKIIIIILLTSVLFSVQHIQYNNFKIDNTLLFQLLYTFIAGIILGITRAKTGNVIIPVLIHSIVNSMLKIISFAR